MHSLAKYNILTNSLKMIVHIEMWLNVFMYLGSDLLAQYQVLHH